MGVKNLLKLIRENAPKSLREIDIAELRGCKVAVDASILLYQFANIGKSHNIQNRDGKQINHIQGIVHRTASMLAAGLLPVYVFDGIPPDSKIRRPQSSVSKSGDTLSRMAQEAQFVLSQIGIPYIIASGEAEAQCAYMTLGEFDAVITEDTDAIVFGAKSVIFGYNATGSRKTFVVNSSALLSELKLSRESFIDLCILLGTDYSGTLPGIGYKRALSLIRQYGDIPTILRHLSEKNKASNNFSYEDARAAYYNPNVSQYSGIEYSKFDPKLAALNIAERFGVDDVRLVRSVEKIANIVSEI